MLNELFLEVALVLVTAGVVALVAHALRQPLIIAYIAAGMLVGPGLLGLVTSIDVFSALSSLGIAFLLFIVGLNLNWRSVKEVGRVAILAGLAQITLTSLAGYVVSRALGFVPTTGLFLAVAFAFSSTIIIVKLLSDKQDLDRLYGRIAVGMLIVQDLIAMIILLCLAAFRDGGSLTDILSISLLKGLIVIIVLWAIARFVVPHLFRYAAKSQELLFLAALAWCFAIASALQLLGFGIEIGALLAGLTLAGTGFHHEIEAKIRPLRDFFLVIFFIVLGTNFTQGSFTAALVPAILFSLFIIVGNPLIVFVIMRLMRYPPRVAFLTGTTVGQISEFSFIVLASGIAAGLIPTSILPLATLVAIITIAVSSYIISFNEELYERLTHWFPGLTTQKPIGEHAGHVGSPVLLFGYDRMGQEIAPKLDDLELDYKVIDFNPVAIEHLAADGVPCMYGDVGSEDVLMVLRAHKAKLVISTIPDMNVNADLLDFFKHHRSHATVIVTARSARDAEKCYALGATFVIVPSILSGQRFADLLTKRKAGKSAWQKEKLVLDR